MPRAAVRSSSNTNRKSYLSLTDRLRRLCRRAPPLGRCRSTHEVCDGITTMQQRDSVSCPGVPGQGTRVRAGHSSAVRTPRHNVSLKDWPDANAAVLQVGGVTEPMPGNSLFDQLADKQLLAYRPVLNRMEHYSHSRVHRLLSVAFLATMRLRARSEFRTVSCSKLWSTSIFLKPCGH